MFSLSHSWNISVFSTFQFFSSVFGHFIVCYHLDEVTERRLRRCPSPSQESRGWLWGRGWGRASWRRSSAGCPDGQPGPEEPLGTNRWYVHLWDRYNRKRRTIRCLIICFFVQWVHIATPRSDPSLQKEQTEPREKFGNILYWNVI